MTTDTADGDVDHRWGDALPDVVDEGGRWSKDVVGETTYRTEWRGYTIEARVQLFADDTYHMQVAAPSEPPAYAEELVVDLLDREPPDPTLGWTLARGWGFDLADLVGVGR